MFKECIVRPFMQGVSNMCFGNDDSDDKINNALWRCDFQETKQSWKNSSASDKVKFCATRTGEATVGLVAVYAASRLRPVLGMGAAALKTIFGRETLKYGSKAVLQNAAKGGVVSLDKLSKAGQIMDRGGLTKAGRALDKHGGRPGSIFPKATGNAASKNRQGQHHLDDIITHPDSIIKQHNRPKYGNVTDIRIPSDRGVRYSQDGNFIMFLEP